MRFVDRVGVCIHSGAPNAGSPYLELPAVQTALDWLGVTHYRDRGTKGLAGLIGHGHILAASGKEAAAAITAGAASIEGPNEPNSTDPSWQAPWQAAWVDVAATVNEQVPLWSTAMNQICPYGNVPARFMTAADVVAVHCYQSGQPLTNFAARITAAVAGQTNITGQWRPWIATETGWHDDTTQGATSQADAASALIPALTTMWQAGAQQVYLYELVDEAGLGGSQAHYGLFNSDWSPKPIATALRAFLAEYGQDDDLAAITLRPELAAQTAAMTQAAALLTT